MVLRFFAGVLVGWFRLGAVIACGLVASSAAMRAAPVWQRVDGEGYMLLSPEKPAEAVAAAGEFADFLAALGAVVKVDAAHLPPLTLVVMRQGRAFRPYRPLSEAGKPQDVAGFFARDVGWAVAVTTDHRDESINRHVLRHEGVHWYLSALEAARPMWVEEGLAEVFATFTHRKGQAVLGEPIPRHQVFLGEAGILPLERLATVTREDPMYDETARAGRFYATSWLLMHYLLFGQHEIPREALNDYLTRLRANEPASEAFEAAFGLDYAGMDAALKRYLRRGRFGYSPSPEADATRLRAVPADALAVEIALAKLATKAERYDQAERHLAQVRALVPADSPLPHELVGHIAAQRRDWSAMLEAYARAMARGSRDAGVYYRSATSSLYVAAGPEPEVGMPQLWHGQDELPQGELRRIANLYKRAINLVPRWRPAYEGLAGILPAIQTTQAADRPFLLQGIALFPDSLALHYALGVADLREGELARAAPRLEQVAASAAERGEPALAGLARAALEDARFVVAMRAVHEAAEAGELVAARAALAELRANGVPTHRRHELPGVERELARMEREAGAAGDAAGTEVP